MANAITKLRILWRLLSGTIREWRNDVWPHDLDEPYCCNGGDGSWNVCGCGGMTIRECYAPDTVSEGHEDE